MTLAAPLRERTTAGPGLDGTFARGGVSGSPCEPQGLVDPKAAPPPPPQQLTLEAA